MKTTGGSVVYENNDGSTEERFLFEYSQEEQEQNQVNAAHAKLLSGIRYINIPIQMVQAGFDLVECTLYGHMYNLLTTKDSRYYFQNSQLAAMLGVSESKITRSIKRLVSAGLIKSTLKLRSGGGKIRFITMPSPTSHHAESNSAESRVHISIKRKVLKDNITKTKVFDVTDKEYKYAQRFYELLKEINPSIKPPNLQRWAAAFDKMLRIDKRDEQQLGQVVKYAMTGFWQGKVLSPTKLIEKYDTLATQILLEQKGTGKQSTALSMVLNNDIEVRTALSGREYVVKKEVPQDFIPPRPEEYNSQFGITPAQWKQHVNDGTIFYIIKDWYERRGDGDTTFEKKYILN